MRRDKTLPPSCAVYPEIFGASNPWSPEVVSRTVDGSCTFNKQIKRITYRKTYAVEISSLKKPRTGEGYDVRNICEMRRYMPALNFPTFRCLERSTYLSILVSNIQLKSDMNFLDDRRME